MLINLTQINKKPIKESQNTSPLSFFNNIQNKQGHTFVTIMNTQSEAKYYVNWIENCTFKTSPKQKNVFSTLSNNAILDVCKVLNMLLHLSIFEKTTLREKYPYSEFFWSVFSRIQTEYGYSVRLREMRTRKTPNTHNFHAVKLKQNHVNGLGP